jgi:hypothetical protein
LIVDRAAILSDMRTARMDCRYAMKQTLLSLITVLVLVSSAHALQTNPPSGICPPGFIETFNVNTPGCTFCAAPTDCSVRCTGPSQCFCPPGDVPCCVDNPCCVNCPEPKPLHCSTRSCSCAPDTCCSTICPAGAPASSAVGLGMLAAVLGAPGYGAVQAKLRRR